MSKITNILLAIFCIVALVSLVISLQNGADVKVGSADYTKIQDGITATAKSVPASYVSASANLVADVNIARTYLRIECPPNQTEVTLQLDDATSTIALRNGIILSAGEYFEMQGPMLYTGKIMGIASSSTSTISVIEK